MKSYDCLHRVILRKKILTNYIVDPFFLNCPTSEIIDTNPENAYLFIYNSNTSIHPSMSRLSLEKLGWDRPVIKVSRGKDELFFFFFWPWLPLSSLNFYTWENYYPLPNWKQYFKNFIFFVINFLLFWYIKKNYRFSLILIHNSIAPKKKINKISCVLKLKKPKR